MEISGGSQAIEEAVSMPGLDLWVFSKPYQQSASGGDIHYLSLCGGGVISRLIIADVSGHGESVAEFSASLRGLMRRNINNKSQMSLVRALNQQFTEMARFRRFATAIVATYLATRRSLTICNAGHPQPLWYRAGADRWELLDQSAHGAGNLPLGLDDETRYHQFALDLAPDDMVLFYTDALTEATDPTGQMLGETGLQGIAKDIGPCAPDEFGRALLSRVEQYRKGRPADDDTTILVLHHNARGPRRASLGEKIDVYAKVFGLKDY
jgi:sigma-B regulation protein RsbU (phosphoserine phosphatase)